VIVDKNGFQAMGRTEEIMGLGDLQAKFKAFGFKSMDVDGHDIEKIDEAISFLSNDRSGTPKVLIANTVKGKGVSFMENNNKWHYSRLNQEIYTQALNELGWQA
jgi:transketolase